VAETNVQLALARAEKERRDRMAANAESELGEKSTFMDKASAAGNYGLNIINEVNRGLISYLPESVRSKFEEAGVGVETDLSETAVGGAARMVGGAAPFAFAAPAAGSVGAPSVVRPGVFKGIIDDISRFAVNHPKLYFGGELAGAAGAGAAGQVADNEGAGPGGQLAAEAAGGLVTGGLATVGPRSLRALREGVKSNLFPMTEEGGSIRAARQMQERVGGPERAQEAAQRLEEIPGDITPARWIGDERLLAQEARILEDNPELAARVRSDLEDAHLAAQESLQDMFGQPRTRQDWERSVLERVTPEGTIIESGMTDDMLDQAYQSFTPYYDQAKGQTISAAGLQRGLTEAPLDENIIASDAEREAIQKWIANQFTAFKDSIVDGEIVSDELLSLRSKIRDQRRAQSKRGNEERADLLGAVENEITARLESGLPDEAVEILRQTDDQYRKYKVVENAIYNSGDSNLTPEQLSQSIRMGGLTSQSRYARGADEATQELRRLALAGRSTEEVLGDPQRAAMFVRDLTDIEQRAVHADFAQTLFNRAKSAKATESGIPLLSGEKLTKDLQANREVMQSLGMDAQDMLRLNGIASQLRAAERKSPEAVDRLFEDGPATILQLAATLAGAKSGQRMAGRGLGSSLVLAQFMSNRARQTLANLTSNEAERLMEDAVTDPKLYRALLTRGTADRPQMRENAQYLESWLLASAFNKEREDGTSQRN
jgi:hypothetical protein